MIVLQTTDFKVGEFGLAQSIKLTPDLQDAITRNEKKYIYQLMGIALGDLFIADLTSGVPTTARFVDIFNAFDKQDNSLVRHSNGIKSLLQANILYDYVTKKILQTSQVGITNSQVDTANDVAYDNSFRYAEQRYNESLETWRNIQWFMATNKTIYPEFIQGVVPTARFSAIL